MPKKYPSTNVITKGILASVFCKGDSCIVMFIDTNGDIIFTIVNCDERLFIARFDLHLRLIDYQPLDIPFTKMTNFKIIRDGGFVCTGVVGYADDPQLTIFAIARFNKYFHMDFYREYELLYMNDTPAIIQDNNGAICCAGIKQLMSNKEVDTHFVYFNPDLTMDLSIRYDETDRAHITSLYNLSDEIIIGYGYKIIHSQRHKDTHESAIMISFSRNFSGECRPSSDRVWIDRSKYPTHLNTIIHTGDALICGGYTHHGNRNHATLWYFEDAHNFKKMTRVSPFDSDNDRDTVYLDVIRINNNLICIGKTYGASEHSEGLFLSKFSLDLTYYHDMGSMKSKHSENIYDSTIIGDMIFHVGGEDSISDDDISVGILKRIKINT